MFKLRMLAVILVFLSVRFNINAQVITRQSQIGVGEYFLGSDPGVGKGTPISISNPATTVISTVFNLSLESKQILFFRFKNANGIWSAPRAITFTGTGVNRSAFVNYVEYFVGSDPGKGSGTQVSITTAQNVPLNLATVNLSQGQHVHLRVRDDQGRWSSPVAFKYPSRWIRAAEVVVGNNPNAVALGDGVAMTPLNGSFGVGTVNVQANISSWNHADTIWVRAQSSDYLWCKPVGRTDTTLQTGVRDSLRVKVESFPKSFFLSQNFPNPFNPSTTIAYDLPEKSRVVIAVYDVLGRNVRTLVDEEKPAGRYQVAFNASSLPSGIYFYRIFARQTSARFSTGSFSDTKKLLLVK